MLFHHKKTQKLQKLNASVYEPKRSVLVLKKDSGVVIIFLTLSEQSACNHSKAISRPTAELVVEAVTFKAA